MSAPHHESIAAVSRALTEAGHADYVEAYRASDIPEHTHQFLFFIKPEIFDATENGRLESRLNLIFERLEAFDFTIERTLVVNGKYLGKFHVVSEHYGVIDSIARNPHSFLPDAGQKTFENEFHLPFDKAHVVGGVEYMRLHHDLTPDVLSHDWLARGYTKLSGGCYCQYLEDEDLYLFNGFYPKLLKHYTRKSARIAVFVISGSIDWETARRDFVGSTNPLDAVDGSVRRLLHEQSEELGLDEISANLNGVHLSAGPVEALVELLRFTENRKKHRRLIKRAHNPDIDRLISAGHHLDFSFGRELAKNFDDRQISYFLSNPDIAMNGSMISIFDSTEDMNAIDAIDTLKEKVDR